MTLIVTHKNHNPLRASKLFPEIVKIAQAKGLNVIGHVYLGPDDPQNPETKIWNCHKCKARNPKPTLNQDGELLTECPNCSYPFLLTKA